VSREFIAKIEAKVARLPFMPDANPKKTHCFDRNKSEYMTIINTKKGQRILGQDT